MPIQFRGQSVRDDAFDSRLPLYHRDVAERADLRFGGQRQAVIWRRCASAPAALCEACGRTPRRGRFMWSISGQHVPRQRESSVGCSPLDAMAMIIAG